MLQTGRRACYRQADVWATDWQTCVLQTGRRACYRLVDVWATDWQTCVLQYIYNSIEGLAHSVSKISMDC